ncbi:LacI family DNA-binding transcriptional regulator [uncultured Oscillibacter sp.]|uniref:LacI family DNA-binding transcriptional regulator n=1 Tax=uncultured Oscillibacter sp. TaxID=876091 RepID=UPI0025E38BE8|nr:LacI family DNA-binding transcriptional regulator [uncultured Oscillibacter sp.]
MVTLKDVAQRAGVSASTVSRVLNGKDLVEEKTRARVLRIAEEMEYRPNVMAKGLKEGRTRTIAFLIPNIENQIYPSLAIAVETEARRQGYFVVFCNTQEDQEREREYIRNLKNRFVDGFLFSTALSGGESRTLLELREEGYPAVCLMRAAPDGTDAFVSDNERGAYLGTGYLLEQGFTRIATVTGRAQLELHRQRLRGYERALRDHGLPVEEDLVWTGVEDQAERAYRCVLEKVEAGCVPQAVFAQSDPLAFDTMRALARAGLRVPEDVSVLGYDNVPFAACYSPALTTVEQPLYEMGRDATRHLIAVIEGRTPAGRPEKRYPPRLVLRDSVGGRRRQRREEAPQ